MKRKPQVRCIVYEITLRGDYADVPSVEVRCTKCRHTTESFGRTGRSVRRCLALMQEECPKREHNYYVAAERGPDDEFRYNEELRFDEPDPSRFDEPGPDPGFYDEPGFDELLFEEPWFDPDE